MDKLLPIGTPIYYTGDMANQDGFGIVSAHREGDKWSSPSMDLYLKDGRTFKAVWPGMFDPAPGRRFMTTETYQRERAEKIARMQADLRKLPAYRDK